MALISRRMFFSIVAGGLLSPRHASAAQSRRFEARTFRSAEVTLPYRIASLTPQRGERYPLVLWLHGGAGRGSDNQAQIAGGNVLGSHVWLARACYVVAPQCPAGTMWSTVDSVEPRPPLVATVALLDELQRALPIDASRIYVAGQSMGGFGTFALLAHFPGRIAAAVPVCGGGNEERAKEIARTPVWAFHGARDKAVPVSRSRTIVAAVRRAGGTIRYTEYPDVEHDSWNHAFTERRLVPWVFAQRRRARR